MKRFKNIRRGLAIAFASLCVTGAALAVGLNCNTYENSTPTYFEDFGYVCAGTGNGCVECYYIDQGE